VRVLLSQLIRESKSRNPDFVKNGSKVAAELNAMQHFSSLFGLKKT